MTRITAPLIAALTLAVAPLAFSQSGKIFDKSYQTGSGRPDLQVLVDDSSVRVQSCGGCHEIHVHVDTRDMNLSDFKLSESQSGNLVRFSLKRPEGMHWSMGRRRQPELSISLPGEADVSLHSGDGALAIAGVSGNLEMRSGDGAISAADVHGTLHTTSGDGSMTLDRVEGVLHATTGDGSLSSSGRFTEVDARSGDGSVQITALDGSTLRDGARIQTGDGSVQLRIPRNLRADVDLRSGDGSVRCDLPLATQSSSDGRHGVRGSLNGGGSAIHVSTGDGSIAVTGL